MNVIKYVKSKKDLIKYLKELEKIDLNYKITLYMKELQSIYRFEISDIKEFDNLKDVLNILETLGSNFTTDVEEFIVPQLGEKHIIGCKYNQLDCVNVRIFDKNNNILDDIFYRVPKMILCIF